jgi:hypothetical protein
VNIEYLDTLVETETDGALMTRYNRIKGDIEYHLLNAGNMSYSVYPYKFITEFPILRKMLLSTGAIKALHYDEVEPGYNTYEKINDISDIIKELEYILFAAMYVYYPSPHKVILTTPWEVK